jgi:orotidine-5'-phosphate decarboxylase
MNFADRLLGAVESKKSPVVAGLDPKLEYVPAFLRGGAGEGLKGAAAAIWEFNRRLIDALYDVVPAVKPQLAYYEMYGLWGLETFYKTVAYAKERGLAVIVDGKRNDIGSTAEAYAASYLGRTALPEGAVSALGADALTVNGYLGADGVKPFVDCCKTEDAGIFVLVKTSNPSSGDLQDRLLQDGRRVSELMADAVDAWGADTVGARGYSAVGAVVGATYPGEAAALRRRMPRAIFLIPGYGAQGAGAAEAVAGFDEKGCGGIVNASRSIMCAYKSPRWGHFGEEGFAQAARAEALDMAAALNRALEAKR